jgi:hypothetical protein
MVERALRIQLEAEMFSLNAGIETCKNNSGGVQSETRPRE